MSNDDGFIQAVRESPADDAPRLVYADWLDEHGDPDRAAFIRLQIEQARRPPDDPGRADLERRAQELLDRHRGAWLTPLARLVGKFEHLIRFRRGFVDELNLHNQEWRAPGLATFLTSPWVSLTTLHLSSSDGDSLPEADARALAGLPGLSGVRYLAVEEVMITDPAAVAVLASAPAWPNVTSLFLFSCDLRPAAVAALAEGLSLPHLRSLSLKANMMTGPGGAQALAGCERLAGLTALDLDWNRVRDDGAVALAGSPQLSGLERLTLSRNELTDVGARALAASPHLGGLTRLSLWDNKGIGPAGWAALTERFGERVGG